MHLQGLLHKLFDNAANFIDTRIHTTLLCCVETLPKSTHLSLTAIGRSLCSKTTVKHTIKRIDRLFGNKTLHAHILPYYKEIAAHFLIHHVRPKISIDWSGLTPCGAFHMISANIALGGRALPILVMAFPESEYTKQKTHSTFLTALASILPDDCHPIIITDAGFRNPWFKLVVKLGWDFVGRVRNLTQYEAVNEAIWSPIKSLYPLASRSPKYLFYTTLAKSNPFKCHFYIYKNQHKNRIKKNLRGKRVKCSVSKKHAKSAKEPWLIVTSLPKNEINPQQIMSIYGLRMQIEEYFRDLKNTRNGFGLRQGRSLRQNRLNVALLIGAMTALLLWVIGLIAKQKKVQFSFQSNSIKHRNVLSVFTIGWQALRQRYFVIKRNDIEWALQEIKLYVAI